MILISRILIKINNLNLNLTENINPLLGDDFSTLGESPAHTTLTVTYRTGGGVVSNVPSNDLAIVTSISTPGGIVNDATALNSLVVTNPNPARGGADEETVDEIRQKAKAIFASQRRAVTREDYEGLLLSMPSRFGSISKCFAKRINPTDTVGYTQSSPTVDYSSMASIVNGLQSYMTAYNTWQVEGENGDPPSPVGYLDFDADTTLGNDGDLNSIQAALNGIVASVADPTITFDPSAIVLYPLSYDNNKYLVRTPDFIKNNASKYINDFKILSDELTFDDGHVINFGVKFKVVSHENVNRSELKLKVIDEIIKYFEPEKMYFNQIIYTKELENVIYNIEGVKVIKELKLSQRSEVLGTSTHLFALISDGTDVQTDGIPADLVSGIGTDSYGHAYDFSQFYGDTGYNNNGYGVIVPPDLSTPSVFELKNPLDNVRGVVE